MMKIVLHAGLVLRRGEKTYEIVRQLNDDEYQLEECITRRPSVIERLTLLKKIWDKTYSVVLPPGSEKGESKDETQEASIDIGSLKESVRAGVERRMEYIEALQKAHVTRGQRKRIEGIVKKVGARLQDARPPSASTVMDWARKYQNSGHSPHALLNGNSTRVRQRRKSDRMNRLVTKMLQTVYLTKAKHTLQHTLDRIRAEAQELVEKKELEAREANISLSTLSRRVREMDFFRRIAAREGIPRARILCRTVMGGAGASYPLERVEVDHTPLNWVVVDDRTGLPLGRPLLTCMIDAFSGYICGIYLSFYGPGLSSVSGVIRNALMPKSEFTRGIVLKNPWIAHGIPDQLVLDNGMEFHSRAFKLMAWELATQLMYCRVRTPWLKPHIERFFASLDYLTLSRGRVHKRVTNVINLDPRKDAAIKFSDLVKGLIMYVADVHPFEVNERKLARSFDLYSEGLEMCPPVAYPGDMHSLKLTSALSKTLSVSQGGVELHGLPYGGVELLPMRKRYGTTFKTLIKWDPDNMSEIYIQDPENKSWTTSPCRWEEYAEGLSWNQHLVIRKFAREKLKSNGAYEYLQTARLELHDHWLNATSHKTSADSALAARYSGVTSARVMGPQQYVIPSAIPAQNLMSQEEVAMTVKAPEATPSFEAFELL
jgi:putative transposase